jgi:hypothetical protein
MAHRHRINPAVRWGCRFDEYGPSIFYKICETPLASGFEHRTDVRDHRHFGERDEKTAVGDVVHRRDDSVADQRAHEFAVAALRRKFRTLFRDFEVPTGVGTFLFGGAPNR